MSISKHFPLAYTVEKLSSDCGVGRTNVYAAVKSGELKTLSPVIAGKPIRRTLISFDEARRWIESFTSGAEKPYE